MSDNCAPGYSCAGPMAQCFHYPRHFNEPCRKGSQCKSQRCGLSYKCLLPRVKLGEKCNTDDDCETFICGRGRCTQGDAGDPCDNNCDCSSDNCNNRRCAGDNASASSLVPVRAGNDQDMGVQVQQVKPYFLMQVGLELNFGSVLKVTFEGEFGMAQANSCGVDDKGYGNFLEGLHSSDFDSNQIATAMNLDSSCDVQRQLFGRLEATITLKLPVLPTLSLSATMAASFDFVQEKGNRKLRFQFSATLNSNIASFVKELSEQSVPIIGKWLGPTIYQGWSESELQLTKSLAMVQFMYANDVQYGTSFRFVGTFRIPNFCPSWLGTLRDTIQVISGLNPGLACSLKRLLDTVMRFCSGVDMKMKISTNDGRLDLSHTSLSVNQKTVTLQDLNDYLNFWDLNNGSNCLADGQCLSGRCAKELKCRDKLDKGCMCWKDDDCKSNRCQKLFCV